MVLDRGWEYSWYCACRTSNLAVRRRCRSCGRPQPDLPVLTPVADAPLRDERPVGPATPISLSHWGLFYAATEGSIP